MRMRVVLLWLSVVVVVNVEGGGKGKSVVTSLDAKWKQTSLVAEASEFMAKESNRLFWLFVERIIGESENLNLSKESDQEKYNLVVKTAADILSPSRMDLLKFSLSLRTHSPAVEMQRQMAIDASPAKSAECLHFADVNGKMVCSLEELESTISSTGDSEKSPVYKMDHVHPNNKEKAVAVVVFYGDIDLPDFPKWHRALKDAARGGNIEYVFRQFKKTPENKKVRLSGYGVELAVKSTEYKAQDDTKIKANLTADGAVVEEEETEDLNGFNFKLLKQLNPDMKESLEQLKLHFLEADELAPLRVWQLQDLSYQAAQRVVAAEKSEAIQILTDISHNFPLMARSLTRTPVKSELRSEVKKNQEEALEDLGISPGETGLFINGIHIDMDTLDIYQLLDLLKKEEKLSAGFFRMGFRREYLSLVMNLNLQTDKSSYAVDYRNGFPLYVNNLDKDKEYRDWGNSVKLMVQPYFPGMIRPIARNFFSLIFIVDPAAKETRNLLKIAYSFYVHEIPVRIGLVFVTNTEKSVSGKEDVGVALLNLFNFINSDSKTPNALRAITDIYDNSKGGEITPKNVIDYFEKKYKDEDADMVFGGDSDYDTSRQSGKQFLESSGLGKAPKVLLNGIPLDEGGISADRFEETVINEVMKITPKIQKAIMDGKLTDAMNVEDWILNQPDVMPRLNTRILGPGGATGTSEETVPGKFLDLTDVMEYKGDKYVEVRDYDDRKINSVIVRSMRYLSRSDEPACRPVTMWVVGDMETVEGRQMYYNAVKQLKHSHKLRIGLIHNPTKHDISLADAHTTRHVQTTLQVLNRHMAKSFVAKLLKEENVKGLKSGKVTLGDLEVHGMDISMFKKEMGLLTNDFLRIHSYYARKILDLKPGDRAVVVNGEIIGPLNDGEGFEADDYALAEKYVLARGAETVAEQVVEWGVDHEEEKSSDLVMRTMALMLADPVKKKRHWVVLADDIHSCVTIPASDESTAAFDIVAVVDPLSREAQKIAPLLNVLTSVVNADFKVVMNPRSKISEMPLKSFYRMVLEPELLFASDGSIRVGPNARFSSLPLKTLLTLNLVPPEAWMVEAIRAPYDLDNIKMEDAQSDIVAEYELEHLLLEGHCFDEVTGNPPRGLQFILGTESLPNMVDTIVMANLGYFQLKASPGVWQLQLRPGRSADIYDITSHHNTDSGSESPLVTVAMDSFMGKIIRIRVQKKPDKIEEKLLDDAEEGGAEGGIWNTISSKFSSGGVGEDEDPTINIFSLASGHLYERFIRIMMLSVVKQTKSPVKFWLLKNYLSPDFKASLPYMAEHYGFSFEFVQYKWPRWLHGQTEKQRVMWGYKILFLDVLFPLGVKKIIFVDADQVVRTDMTELMRFDLEGAPYGYTPFCDSRTDMEGFRFWKKGYWAQHMGHRRYHISALYVVDLKKFRQIAAGDRLRGQYQGLSADPNSLSNLDQDLPNNMIHQVKIKSLPQEWLWCATWCDEKSKRYAKTIDLCNNPQTKEPKLTSAMRIIEEWKYYDEEIKGLMENYAKGEAAGRSPDAVPPSPTPSHAPHLSNTPTPDHLHHEL